jgi:REP element-mobilizing transposase RayT
MVLASHGIFTAYGFWLPNDPRGSWSDFVRSWDLLAFGNATKIDDTRSVAHKSHDRRSRLAAKAALKYPLIHFTGRQALAIARGFARAIAESNYRIHACSILPQHVHLVSQRHDRPVEKIMGHLKARATQQLVDEGLHPFVHLRGTDSRFPSVWADRSWKVFLNTRLDIERSIRYVHENPIKDGKKKQQWSFVTPIKV